jgi:ectoine hydroxylase-related dioxygenase (phytanoyl-CoA dioxygenase family)
MFFSKIISKSKISNFNDDGVVVVKNIINKRIIKRIISEIEIITHDQLKKNRQKIKKTNLKNLIKFAFKDKKSDIRFFLYHRLRSLPTIQSLCFSDELSKILKNFGHSIPACVQKPTVRFDFAEEDQHKLKPHQDIRAILCSKCITVWIPITSVNEKNGTIRVYKKSHKEGLLNHTFDKNNQVVIKNLKTLKKYEYLDINAQAGDMIIMNSFCAHSSIKGKKNSVKINIQSFYNDLIEIDMKDKFYSLQKIPNAGKKTLYNEYK